MTPPIARPQGDTERPASGIAPLPLAIGLALMLLLTALPGLATDRAGRADHLAAMLLFWAMSAGFVRGVGFIPQHRLPRLLLSGLACALALSLALARLVLAGHLPWQQ